MNDDQLLRYSRHILLPEVGIEGQRRIRRARVLIVGAGATGGAFGTLLQEAGRDVTYLLRPTRAARLRRDGLRFISPEGDRTNQVQTLVAGEPAAPFDLVIVAVKAYALDAALEDLRPYVGPKTLIMPILNGMAQIDKINAALDYDVTRPVDALNQPRLYVCNRCRNTIFALQEWTGRDGKHGASKDPVDVLRYFVLSDPIHAAGRRLSPTGGGSY